MDYTIVLEGSPEEGFSAFSPDLEGVVATGGTEKIVRERIVSGISFHLRMLREAGMPIPAPSTKVFIHHVDTA